MIRTFVGHKTNITRERCVHVQALSPWACQTAWQRYLSGTCIRIADFASSGQNHWIVIEPLRLKGRSSASQGLAHHILAAKLQEYCTSILPKCILRPLQCAKETQGPEVLTEAVFNAGPDLRHLQQYHCGNQCSAKIEWAFSERVSHQGVYFRSCLYFTKVVPLTTVIWKNATLDVLAHMHFKMSTSCCNEPYATSAD